MPGSFAFVDNFAIDSRSRKQIRSHVMKGKNTAKARIAAAARKRRDVDAAANAPGAGNDDDDDNDLAAKQQKEDESLDLILQSCHSRLQAATLGPLALARVRGDFCGVQFPAPMDDRSRTLIKEFYTHHGTFMYPPEFCLQVLDLPEPWFHFVVQDEAYLYGAIAICTATLDIAQGKRILSPEYKRYFSRCVSLLNAKLSSTKAAEISTVALVVGLCVLAAAVQDFDAQRVHTQGLRQVVAVRGGIHTLVAEPNVVEKVMRADLEDALTSGGMPLWAAHFSNLKRQPPLPTLPGVEFPGLDSIRAIHPGLADAAQDTQLLTRFLQSITRETRLIPTDYHSHITCTFGTVFALGPIGVTPFSDPVAELLHLTLIAKLCPLVVQFGFPNERRYDVIIRRTTWAVDNMMVAAGSTLATVIDPRLMNWILHILAVSILHRDWQSWLLPKMQLVREALGLASWQEALAAAQEYPWLPTIQDKHISDLFLGPVPGSRKLQPLPGWSVAFGGYLQCSEKQISLAKRI